MCLHFTRASLVTSCVRRLRRHVRAYVDIALASGCYIWKRRARRIAIITLTRSPPAQYIQNQYSSVGKLVTSGEQDVLYY